MFGMRGKYPVNESLCVPSPSCFFSVLPSVPLGVTELACGGGVAASVG